MSYPNLIKIALLIKIAFNNKQNETVGWIGGDPTEAAENFLIVIFTIFSSENFEENLVLMYSKFDFFLKYSRL